METPVLKVEPRSDTGKGAAARLRRAGGIPAICYGKGKQPLAFAVKPEQLYAIIKGPRGMNSLIQIEGAGETRTVFVQAMQKHPVQRNVLHVDFVSVDTTLPVRRNVPIEFAGKPEGVKEGGVLQIARRQLLIETLPASIPDKISINVEALIVGQSIHVEEVKLPEGIKAIFERNFTICAVVVPTEEKEPEPEVVAEGEEGAVPAEGAAGAEGAAKPGEEGKAAAAGGDKKPADAKGGAADKKAAPGADKKAAPGADKKAAPKGPAKK